MRARLGAGLWTLRWPLLLLTMALFLLGLFHPFPFGLALRLWLVGVAGLGANLLVREAVGLYDPLLIARPRWRRNKEFPAPRPADLAEVERAVRLSAWSGFDVRLRLTPLFRQIARQRLAGHLGINLDLQPAAAERALGPALWKLIQPDGALPIRDTPGLGTREIRGIVEALEGL